MRMSFLSYLLNINLQIPNKHFCEKSAFEPGLLFLRERGLFPNLFVFIFVAKPLYHNVCIDHRIIFIFW